MPCLLFLTAAAALSTDVRVRDLRHTGWGPKEGAPGAIVALSQTADGYIYAGNSGGLYRFDGLRFEQVHLPHDERLSSMNIQALHAPSSSGLWIGFTMGGAAFLKDGRMTVYAERDGLPRGSVTDFAQAQDGTVWAATYTGMARLEGSRWRTVGPEHGYSDTQTQALMIDSAGTLWAASPNKVLYLRKGETEFREAAVKPATQWTLGIAESPTGAVWFADAKGIHQLHKNDNHSRRTATSGKDLLFDRDGGLWTFRSDGELLRIARPENSAVRFLTSSPDPSDVFSVKDGRTSRSGFGAMLEDREGNVWISSDVGLDRFSERNVSSIPPLEHGVEGMFSSYNAGLAPGDEGTVWIGGRGFGLFSFDGSRAKQHRRVGYISCAIRTEDGSILFGGSKGLWRYSSGRFDHTPPPNGTDGLDVQTMTQDRSGAIWVSIIREGVFRLANGVWTAHGGIASLPKLTAIVSSTDAIGRVWFGYTEGRVAMLDGTSVRLFADKDRLPIGNVTALYGRNGRVWAGGEFGLALFDETGFRPVVPESDVVFNTITGIVETAAGALWLNGSAGIMHLPAEEVRRVVAQPSHRARVETFNALDGVQGSAAKLRALPTAVEGTDGRLWFVRTIGIYSIDPQRIFRNPVPPPVWIRSLTVDNKTYAPQADLRLPHRSSSVRIDFVGLSLTMAEKVRYRYKLDGVDKDWQDVGGRAQAFYTNLGPGTHRFQVIAANNDGVWNSTGATLHFTIPPTFVQTGWFVALCALGAGLLVWVLVRLRVGQVAGRLRVRLEARMAERERIARELHDTLLQSTHGLILRFQAVADQLPADDPIRAMLEKTLDRADEVVAEGRDRVLDLRVPAQASADLASAFATAGDELAEGHRVAFHAVVRGRTRALHPSVTDEAYRIGREAIVNAFHHAEAGSIEVEVIYADEAFGVLVRDDGVGIQDRVLATGVPGHWGLKGMRERAQHMGAQLDIRSRAGCTEVDLRVPATLAYQAKEPSLRRWLPHAPGRRKTPAR